MQKLTLGKDKHCLKSNSRCWQSWDSNPDLPDFKPCAHPTPQPPWQKGAIRESDYGLGKEEREAKKYYDTGPK